MTENEQEKSVTEIIEEVKHEICDGYCKYSGMYTDDGDFLEVCKNGCPLDRL